MNDQAGRSTAATLFMPIRRGRTIWLRLLFLVARHVGLVTAPMRRLSTIHFLQWTVLRAVPDASGGTRRLARPWLWFESNFDDDLNQYIDAFARAVPWRMRAVWGSAADYPGLFPSPPYQEWTNANAVPAAHYWCAYPEATTAMVGAALRVGERYRTFRAAVRGVDEHRFSTEYERFLTEVQGDL